MNTTKLTSDTHKTIDEYINMLDEFSYEQIIQKPSNGGWSIGQVYIHLWMASKGFFYKNAEACKSNTNTFNSKSKNWIGYLVFLFGKMPTIKVKMPEKVAVEPRQPESKEQLITKLNGVKSLFDQYVSLTESIDPKAKTKHPFLGFLNFEEWLTLCKIHFKHHKAQINRIKKDLGI